jgi:hypothetical protein
MKPTRECARLGLPAAVLAIALACSSPPDKQPDLGPAPTIFDGFPSLASEDGISVAATYNPDHPRLFRMDLVREHSIIPVHVRVEQRQSAAEGRDVRLSQTEWNPVLFLQDGTAARLIGTEAVAELDEDSASIVREQAFRTDFVRTEPLEGYLFFKLEPVAAGESFRIVGRKVVHRRKASFRELDLYHSMLSFSVTVDDELRPFYVGIMPR